MRTISRVHVPVLSGGTRRFSVKDNVLAVASLKESEIDHSFDEPIVVHFQKNGISA